MLWSSALQVVTSQAGCSSAQWDPFLGKWREINLIASSASIQTSPMWIQFVYRHSHTHTPNHIPVAAHLLFVYIYLHIYIYFPIIFFRVVQRDVQGPRSLKAAWTKALQPAVTQNPQAVCEVSQQQKQTIRLCQEHPCIHSTYLLLHWPIAKWHHNNPNTVYSSGSILRLSSKWGDIMSGTWEMLYSRKQAVFWVDAEMNCMIPTSSS